MGNDFSFPQREVNLIEKERMQREKIGLRKPDGGGKGPHGADGSDMSSVLIGLDGGRDCCWILCGCRGIGGRAGEAAYA